jgi:hypothetical protein
MPCIANLFAALFILVDFIGNNSDVGVRAANPQESFLVGRSWQQSRHKCLAMKVLWGFDPQAPYFQQSLAYSLCPQRSVALFHFLF